MTSSGPILLGNGTFPWNLRPHRHYSERICFFTSLVGNTLLIALIKLEKSPVMKPYNRVLLLNIAFDYFYTIMSMVVEMELENNDGVYIFVINGLPKDLSPHAQKVAVAVWMFAIATVCTVSPVEFIFRYCRVVKNYTVSYAFLALMAGVVVLVSAELAASLYAALESVEDHNATFGHLMNDPMWLQGDGRRAIFYGASIDNPFFRLHLASCCVDDFLIFGTVLFTSIRTMQALAADKNTMSEKTRYMQSQLNRLMLAEAISLTSVFVIPVGISQSFLIFRLQWAGFGVLLTIFVEWVPAVNPITTILLVGPYRRQLAGLFSRKKTVAVSDSSDPQATATASRTG